MTRKRRHALGHRPLERLGFESLEVRQMMTQLVEHLGGGTMCDAPVVRSLNGEEAVYFSGNLPGGCGTRTDYEGFWRTDGTADGTFALGHEVAEAIFADSLAEVDGQLYFGIWTNGQGEFHVLSTDGLGISTFSEDSGIVGEINGSLLYVCYFCVDQDSQHLMSFDGDDRVPLWDLRSNASHLNPSNRVQLGTRVYFGGDRLWQTDGTIEGTRVFHQDSRDTEDTFEEYRIIGKTCSGAFYFWRMVGTDLELWMTDGTAEGTLQVRHPGLREAQVHSSIMEGDSLLVMVVGRTDLHLRPLLVHGTEATMLSTDSPVISRSNSDTALYNWNGKLVIVIGNQLLFTDGTEVGTENLHRISTAFEYSTERMFHTDEYLYFETPPFSQNEFGRWFGRIYRANGEGAERIVGEHGRILATTDNLSIYQSGDSIWTLGDGESEPVLFAERLGVEALDVLTTFSNGEILFTAKDGQDRKFWTTDGTFAGTRVYSDLSPSLYFDRLGVELPPYDFRHFTLFGDRLVFETLYAFGHYAHLFSMPTPAALERNSDVNSDGVVDSIDFLVLQEHFGTTEAGDAQGDIDDDGVIDFTDYLLLSRVIDQAKRT